jgi:hypothetical protein
MQRYVTINQWKEFHNERRHMMLQLQIDDRARETMGMGVFIQGYYDENNVNA